MSPEYTGAILDFGYLMALWAPGILLVRVIGQKNPWTSLTVGFLLSTMAVMLLFHVTASFGATDTWWLTSKIFLLAVLATTVGISFRKRDVAALTPLSIALAITAAAVITRNLFRLDGGFGGQDQFMVGWISSLAQSGHDPSLFGGANYVKRGFAFPLLLAQGREGQLLLSITLVILILAIISTFLLASAIGTQWNILGISLGISLVVFWLTAPIVWGMAFYMNGHVLMALAVSVLATQIVGKDTEMTRTPIELVAIFAAGFTLASTRPEGVVLALILSLPLLLRPPLETHRQAVWRLTTLLGGPLGFVLWIIATTNSLPFSLLANIMVSLGVFLSVAAVFFTFFAKPSWHRIFMVVVGVILLALALLQLMSIPPRLGSLNNLVYNTFLGGGDWGTLSWVFLGAFLLHALIKTDKRVTDLVLITSFATLFTIAAKIVDGLFTFGGLTGVRLGWGDSTNRALFHLIALFSALFLRLGTLIPDWDKEHSEGPTPVSKASNGKQSF